MPYIDNPDFTFPDPTTYDVLVQNTSGTTTLLTGQEETGSGLTESAFAAVERHREETGNDVTLVDAWVSGGRVWSTNEASPTPMRPVQPDAAE